MKQKLYLVNYYSHLVGDSVNYGVYLDENKAKNKYLELVEEHKESILNKAINDEENPRGAYKDALNSSTFYGDDDNEFTLCKIETLEIENVKIGEKLFIYNFCDEDLENSKTWKLFKTSNEKNKELLNALKRDEDYFDENLEVDLTSESDDWDEKDFEKYKKKQIKNAKKIDCVYCYESGSSEYFCHKFGEVVIE